MVNKSTFEKISFDHFCETVLKIPAKLGRLMLEGIHPGIPSINKHVPLPPTKSMFWKYDPIYLNRIQKNFQNLSKQDKLKVEKLKKEFEFKDPEILGRKELLYEIDKIITVFCYFKNFSKSPNYNYQNLCLTHIYDWDTGKKLSDHLWIRQLDFNSKFLKGIKPNNYFKLKGKVYKYYTDDLTRVSYGINPLIFKQLTIKEAKEWKNKILKKL